MKTNQRGSADVFILIVAIIVVIAGVVFLVFNTLSDDTNEQTQTTASTSIATQAYEDEFLSIEYPENWVLNSDSETRALNELNFSSPDFAVSNSTIIGADIFMNRSTNDRSAFDEVQDDLDDISGESFQSVVIEDDTSTFKGLEARRIETAFNHNRSSERIRSISFKIKSQGTIFSFIAIANEADWDEYKAEIEATLESIDIKQRS